MPDRRAKAIAVIIIFCLIFTFSACAKKDGAEGSDSATVMGPGADAGADGSGIGKDGADAVPGGSGARAVNDQGNALPDAGMTLETLKDGGFKVFIEQSYDIVLENYGQVTFVTGSVEVDGLLKLKMYLMDGNGKVLYELPNFYGNSWSMLSEVTDVALNDLNHDGLKDIIVIACYMTGVGPTGAEDFPTVGVYFQHGREFVSIPWLDDEINMNDMEISIVGVADYVEKLGPEKLAPYISNGNSSTGDTASLDSWVGDYSFNEYAPPDQNMFYSIYIFKEGIYHYAEIYIDGFQTMLRLKARVIENGDGIDLLFDSYLPDNLFDIYEKGDHLLSLERSGSKLLTYWALIEPMLSENKAAGGAYFEKAEYPVLLMSFNVNFGMEESFEVLQLTDKTVTYIYYDYSDASNPQLKEKTVPFSEMLAKEDNGEDRFYMSIFLYDGYNVRELELTEKLDNRIKKDPEFRKKLGALIGKHFDRELKNDFIDVEDIE